jgi:hypothetical protein
MKPTAKLRFVERLVPAVVHGEPVLKAVRTLQQWWEVENSTDALHNNLLDGEWRDIPLENEE